MKKFASIVLALTMVSSLCVPAFAATKAEAPETSATSTEVSPRIYWKGTVALNTTSYTTITDSNNIFPDSPKVISHIDNPGPVSIRVIDEDGQPVGKSYTVAAGNDVTLDRIPAFTGTYTIQGKATMTSGNFTFTID